MRSKTATWWGSYELPIEQAGVWRIGPLSLQIRHLEREWRVLHDTADDPLDSALAIDVPSSTEPLAELASVRRFALGDNKATVTLSAALPDRSIVTRPETPFHLPPAESTTLYVGTPLWVQISVGRPPTLLTEIPVFRPSDTWFGPPTVEGELCYATRTACRLDIAGLPLRPHRAVTTVRIRNHAPTALGVERLKLPVRRLALYHAPGGQLWTQDVTFERHGGHDEFAALRLQDGPPPGVPNAELLSEPRDVGRNMDWFRAFGVLFSRSREG